MQMLKDRGEPIPQEDLRQVAKEVKVFEFYPIISQGKILLLCW
jgi:hypothetical protein